jgi:hypothetical protein
MSRPRVFQSEKQINVSIFPGHFPSRCCIINVLFDGNASIDLLQVSEYWTALPPPFLPVANPIDLFDDAFAPGRNI